MRHHVPRPLRGMILICAGNGYYPPNGGTPAVPKSPFLRRDLLEVLDLAVRRTRATLGNLDDTPEADAMTAVTRDLAGALTGDDRAQCGESARDALRRFADRPGTEDAVLALFGRAVDAIQAQSAISIKVVGDAEDSG